MSDSNSNVLAALFSDIANAIRTKTGGTDKMAPAAFPENILGIEGGGDAGGETLPAGVYLEVDSVIIAPTLGFRGTWFTFNNELYVVGNAGGGSEWTTFYKYSAGGWETITFESASTGLGSAGNAVRFHEYHGACHIINLKGHCIFDGETLTVMSSIPDSIEYGSSFVWNDTIMAYGVSTGILYAWDESSDTWSAYYTAVKGTYYYWFVVNNEPYCLAPTGKKVYKFSNGNLEEITTYPLSYNTTSLTVYKGCAYFTGSRGNTTYDYRYKTLFKFDPKAGSVSQLGFVPAMRTGNTTGYEKYTFYVYNGQLRVAIGVLTNMSEVNYIVHIIEETA